MVGRAAEVDLARRRPPRNVEGALELVRDVERADEVAAGAAVDDRELDVVDSRDAVHDLVHRAVAADGHDQACATRRGVVREFGQVLRSFGEERISGQPAVGCAACDLGPALPGRASVRGWVDEERGLANRT